jgi:two-component system, NtrC family, sensor kinase
MRLGVLFRRRRSAPRGLFLWKPDVFAATQDRLVQRQKLASLGQLTAGIAHEIKNPLNFVNNFLSVSAELLYELRENLGKVKADAALTHTMQRLQVELIGGLRRHKLHRWT